jgi:hypothetical protein
MIRRSHRRLALLATLARATTVLTALGFHARPSRHYFALPWFLLCQFPVYCSLFGLNVAVVKPPRGPLAPRSLDSVARETNYLYCQCVSSPQSLIASEVVRCVFFLNKSSFVPLMGPECGKP